jgi:peptide-methionine (R)-S-oxide reductase
MRQSHSGVLVALALAAAGALHLGAEAPPSASPAPPQEAKVDRIVKTADEWKKELSTEQFRVLRQKGTEMAFTGGYWNDHSEGVFRCAGCGTELFNSGAKFDSGTGWPSFTAPIAKGRVAENRDESHGMIRIEVVCARRDGHLGHVFPDGPAPTGLRYCINSVSLKLQKAGEKGEKPDGKKDGAGPGK